MTIPSSLHQACIELRQGKLIAYPTEGVYGLGCDPWNEQAVGQLLNLKERSIDKGLIVITASWRQAKEFVDLKQLSDPSKLFSEYSDPITWLMPAAATVPYWLRGAHDTIAIRITQHPIANQLCTLFGGGVVSTSANRSSEPPALTMNEVRDYFTTEQLALIIDGPLGDLTGPTPIHHYQTTHIIRR